MAKRKKSVEELIENLARSTKEGFDRMDKRFDSVEERLERVEFYATGHERRLELLEDKVRQISTKIGFRPR